MRVMYVTPGLGGGGGAEKSLASMVPAWRDRIELHVVSLTTRMDLADALRANEVAVDSLGSPSRVSAITRLRDLIRETKPDLVHTVLFDADIVGRLATPFDVPMSTSLVNTNYGKEHWSGPERTRFKVKSAQAVDAITAQRVRAFHALSTNVADVMSKRLAIPRRRMVVIPRGRDRQEVGYPSRERSRRTRKALGVGDRPLVVATARHEWQKGLDLLIAGMPTIRASVPDVALRIGGRTGQETERLHSLARLHGLDPSTVFIGPRDDVADLMCAADVFCVPSRWEGLGSILVEAMALGAPVLAADVPPIREIDPREHWLNLFRTGDSQSLARRAAEMLARGNEPKRAEFAVEMFERTYRSELVARQMLTFFETAGTGST